MQAQTKKRRSEETATPEKRKKSRGAFTSDEDQQLGALLKLSAPTIQALAEVLQYESFTQVPICRCTWLMPCLQVQTKCLPHLLKGRDVVVKAQTGSGCCAV